MVSAQVADYRTVLEPDNAIDTVVICPFPRLDFNTRSNHLKVPVQSWQLDTWPSRRHDIPSCSPFLHVAHDARGVACLYESGHWHSASPLLIRAVFVWTEAQYTSVWFFPASLDAVTRIDTKFVVPYRWCLHAVCRRAIVDVSILVCL